jgi:hypothetical protein
VESRRDEEGGNCDEREVGREGKGSGNRRWRTDFTDLGWSIYE